MNRRCRARQRIVQAYLKSAIRDFPSETIPTQLPIIQNALRLKEKKNGELMRCSLRCKKKKKKNVGVLVRTHARRLARQTLVGGKL